jgi:Uma2 family endonuclease
MTVVATVKRKATIDDLYAVPGKAELINGEIVHFMPTEGMPTFAAGEIFVSLRGFRRSQHITGIAVSDNAGFRVSLPNRESFSPDAAYYVGPNPGMRFFEGAPLFAAEVRSENDYGPAAEQDIAAKRRDYFAAGTQVVWDVDLQSDRVVVKYLANAPESPVTFGRGEWADAEPVLTGWRMRVDDLFAAEEG